MPKPPKKWEYILIELEIDGKVVDSRIASQSTYDYLNFALIRQGQTQTLPWALFISQYRRRRKTPQVDNSWQKRDSTGKFIKTDKSELIITNTI